MKIEICQNREKWDKYQKDQQNTSASLAPAEFLQSFDWGEFQKNTGKVVLRLDVQGEPIQGFEHKLGLGKYLYIPRLKISDIGLGDLVEYLKIKKYIFLRLEPITPFKLKAKSYKLQAIKNRQPKQTLILDLKHSEEELLSAMHAKTRYNIHVAEKHEIEVREEKNVEVFWKLNQETTSRDKFKSHDKKYYGDMLSMPACHQLVAYYQGQPIAANILIICGNTTTYLHGASSSSSRNLMAPYLLQWQGIKLAQKFGCTYYDFWGVAPRAEENMGQSTCFNNFCWEVNHRWTGVTRFKAGFGGKYREYPEGCDIILRSLLYKLYQLLKKFL
jgi:lipid II:glycine glycyltransferase (peptidoglycan interpeptide bridge formation enzyme)